MSNFKYDIALSFADEDRKYVREVAEFLDNNGVTVFYDEFSEVEMWAVNLYDYLSDIYRNKARYTIMFISEHYGRKRWTDHERQSMQTRAFEENRTYILPVRFDDTNIPGILSTTHCISLHNKTPEQLAELTIKKLNLLRQELLQKELKEMDSRSIIEGLKSPTEWFINWQGIINKPLPPPRHWLLHKVFIERDIYSVILDNYLTGGKSAGITGFIGMGGVGKTYMALKIAWELIDEYQWQVVWVGLLQQGTDEALEQIAKSFGLFFAQSLKTEEKVAAIRVLFQKVINQYPKLLVVLDNAENFPRLDLLLEAFREIPVLVTSRRTECADVIPYKKLEPLSGDDALRFCASLLNHFNIHLDTSKHDNEDLIQLCKKLGGHPLGIRLALTGFVKKPLLKKNKKHRFLLLLEEIQNKGIAQLATQNPQGDSLDEHQLHNNIASTFNWTYEELIIEDKDVYHKGAFFLLPIMSALGTTNVSMNLCKQGLDYIVKNISNPTLELLSTNQQALENSISLLIELALVEILDADKQFYALHPLIREFAFYHCDKYSFSGSLSSELIFRMAIEIVGNEHGNEALLDLLPRLKKSRQLVELAIEQVKKHHFHKSYYDVLSNRWSYLEKLLEATYLLATEFSLEEDQVWVLLKLGELKDRMEDNKGFLLIEEGIQLFIKKERKPQFKELPLDTLYDWVILVSPAKNNILWAAIYLSLYEKENKSQEDTFRHALKIIRLLPEDKIYEKNRIISGYIQENLSINILNNIPAHLRSLNQTLVSNIIIDLTEWVKIDFSVFVKYETIEQGEKLFNFAVENMNKLKENKDYVISPEHKFYFKTTISFLLFEHNLTNEAEFEKQITDLRQQLLASGIRGYDLEIQYCKILAKKHFENKNWQQVIKFIEQALLCLQEIPENKKLPYQASLELLKLSAQTFLNQSYQELALLAGQLKSISSNEKAIIHALPLVYLAQACLYSAQGTNEACSIAMAQCEKCFQQQTGAIPPFVRPLANQWRNWSLAPHKIVTNDLITWRVDYATLPARVKSKRDGKIMRLIHPGIQWNKEGKENWLYPFYIDETPINYANLKAYFTEQDITILGENFNDNDLISLSNADSCNYSYWCNKKIPNKEELFVAWLQLEHNIYPEQWHSIEEASAGMIKRIENVLSTGEPFYKDWEAEPLSNSSVYQVCNNDITNIEDAIENNDIFSITENLDEFYKAEWLLSNATLAKKYQKYFVERIAKTPISKEQQERFSLLLVTSISLSIQEKVRILDAADKENGESLSVSQCEELIEVFEDERVKFTKLVLKESETIKKLCKEHLSDFLCIIKVSSVKKVSNCHPWFVYASDPAHTDLWLNRDKQDFKIDKWYVSLNDKKPENVEPVLLCVVPIYTQRDLDDLEPI